MFSYNGYDFLKEKYDVINISKWKCNQYFKTKCRELIHLSDGEMSKNTEHNYASNPTGFDVKKTFNKLKEIDINNTNLSVQSIVKTALSQIHLESAIHLQ